MIMLEQIRAARAMLGLKQNELAEKAGISTGTLNNIERGVQSDPKVSTLRAIQQALEAEGIEFISLENGVYGVQQKLRKKNASATVLIIDDSDATRALYRAWLTRESSKNYKIIEAENAKSGYEAFLEHSPDCIILDFMMYGKDGFQMLVEMKQEHSAIPPIVFVTALHSDTIKKDVQALGVHAYLDKKTLTKEQLCQIVEKAVF